MEEGNEPIETIATSQSDVVWLEYINKIQQEQPKRLEDAAKYLSGAISISFSIFLQLNSNAFKGVGASPFMFAAIILWLISLIATLWVIMPAKYSYTPSSAKSIKTMIKNAGDKKYFWLNVGRCSFIAALILIGWLYFDNNFLKERDVKPSLPPATVIQPSKK